MRLTTKFTALGMATILFLTETISGHTDPPVTGALQALARISAEPMVRSFAQSGKKWLRAGETLTATLEGTPGGQAAFHVPGLLDNIVLREASPGHYVGDWKVPEGRPVQFNSGAVIGSLKVGDKMALPLQAADNLSVDTVLPEAREFAPEDGTNVNDPRPTIGAVIDDQGSGIDRKSIALLINGQNVTDQATVTSDFISYRPAEPLNAGQQRVELRLADAAGNRTEAHWRFMQQPPGVGGIKSVNNNVTRVLHPGDTMRVAMIASPGGLATFTVGAIPDTPMTEDQPGHYIAYYKIQKGDEVSGRPITYQLAMPEGEKFEQASQNTVQVTSGKPARPVVKSPGLKVSPSSPLVVHGTANPNNRVHVRIDYRNHWLGSAAFQGTAADVVVMADKSGTWQTEPIPMGSILAHRGVEATISAVAINAAHEASDTAVTRFHIL